jgi:hypothetical protein
VSRRRRRSTGSGGRRWVSLLVVALVVASLLAAGNAPTAFTTATTERGSAANVVGDADGLVGVDVAGSVAAGSEDRLVTVTNNFGESVTVSVSLDGADGTLSNAEATLAPGASLTTSVTVDCDAPPDVVRFTVRVTTNGTLGAVSRSSSVTTDDCRSDPPGPVAFNDADGDGSYDAGETTYTKNDLETGFDDPSVDLVIPSDVGVLKPRGAIRARSITLRTEIRARGLGVTLTAERDVDVSGQQISSQGAPISITAGRSGTGDLVASGAVLDTNKAISLAANGDVSLDGASLTAGGTDGLSADLGVSDATLDVTGASLTDGDDALTYGPAGVTVVGSPSSGSVRAR